jgi:hypothetical protein
MSFERNVFINCPFDEDYYLLLRPILFTIIYLGFTPRIASENSDSGVARFDKICNLIRSSMYSIHDLSRLKSTSQGEYARQNMPFELGLDVGCRRFSSGQLKNKKFLILEIDQFRYRQALSDISGFDIKSHNNNPSKLVIQVRNWFVETIGLRNIPTGFMIWNQFTNYTAEFYDQRKSESYTTEEELNMMPIPEYIDFIKEWCQSSNAEQYAAVTKQ